MGCWCVPGASPQNKAGANGKKGARTSVGAMNLLANAAEDNEAYEHLLTPAQLHQLQQHLGVQVRVLPGPSLTAWLGSTITSGLLSVQDMSLRSLSSHGFTRHHHHSTPDHNYTFNAVLQHCHTCRYDCLCASLSLPILCDTV